MKLEEIRKKLDKIDKSIVRLVAKRLSYMPYVAKYKKEHDLPIYDASREKKVIKSRKMLAQKLNINPNLIEKIFIAIMKESRDIQKKDKLR